MKYLVTVKVCEENNRYVRNTKQYSMSSKKLHKLIKFINSLFGEDCDEKISIEGGILTRYEFESRRLIVGAHPLDTNADDFVKTAL